MNEKSIKIILNGDNPFYQVIAESIEDFEKGREIPFDEFFTEIEKEHGFKREL